MLDIAGQDTEQQGTDPEDTAQKAAGQPRRTEQRMPAARMPAVGKPAAGMPAAGTLAVDTLVVGTLAVDMVAHTVALLRRPAGDNLDMQLGTQQAARSLAGVDIPDTEAWHTRGMAVRSLVEGHSNQEAVDWLRSQFSLCFCLL